MVLIMTTQRIAQEIYNRIDFLEKKKAELPASEIHINERREHKEAYDKELDVLYTIAHQLNKAGFNSRDS